MAGDWGWGHSQQWEQLKQRQEGEVWFQGRVSQGLRAAGIEGSRKENDRGGQAHAREDLECWAKQRGLCRGQPGGGLKQEV